jgi:hypothetical protein
MSITGISAAVSDKYPWSFGGFVRIDPADEAVEFCVAHGMQLSIS